MTRRRVIHGVALLAALAGACGGPARYAPMPDVARTDRSADELGLPREHDEASPDAAATASPDERATDAEDEASPDEPPP